MSSSPAADLLVPTFHTALLTAVRRNATNLSLRQFVVFLSLYLEEGTHTVRDLAAHLRLPKSIVIRVLDHLTELKLARREGDAADLSSIVVQRTPMGERLLHELSAIIADAGAAHGVTCRDRTSR